MELRTALLTALAAACAPAPQPGSVSAARTAEVNGRELRDEIVTVPTRGVTQSFLLVTAPGSTPATVALMFPGGNGLLQLPSDVAAFMPNSNFLVRARGFFVDDALAVALLDAPSDRQGQGVDDAFRASAAHAQDVRAVLAHLRRRFPGARMFLVGTSRGTVSAAQVGSALGSEIDGVVLTSSVFEASRREEGLSRFDFHRIQAPLLLVHHADDACGPCPYARAAALGRSVPLVTVHGGLAAEAGPCQALAAHGYLGREEGTARAIRSWILGQDFPRSVQ